MWSGLFGDLASAALLVAGGGIAVAVKATRPDVRIIGVEAERVPSAARSREAGRIVTTGSSEPAIQVLRAVAGVEALRNQEQRAPSATARSGFLARPSAISM